MAIDQVDTSSYEQDLAAQEAAAKRAAEEQERERKQGVVLAALQARYPERVISNYTVYNQIQLALDKQAGTYHPVDNGENGGSLVIRFDYLGKEGGASDHIYINNRDRGGLDEETINMVGLEAMAQPPVNVYPDEVVSQNYIS